MRRIGGDRRWRDAQRQSVGRIGDREWVAFLDGSVNVVGRAEADVHLARRHQGHRIDSGTADAWIVLRQLLEEFPAVKLAHAYAPHPGTAAERRMPSTDEAF